MNGLDRHSLFLYCDPLETDVPDRSRVGVTVNINSIYKQIRGRSNTAVINSMGGFHTITENNSRDSIDNGCHRLIGVTGKRRSTFRNFTIRNVELNTQVGKAPQCQLSHRTTATFENLRVESFTINGQPISRVHAEREAPAQGQFWCTGETDALVFSGLPSSR